MLGTLIYDILIILAAGLVAGLICRRLRVSVIVGYLVVGTLLGKGMLGWVDDEHHQIEYIAEAGVFLLLFAIGLEFSLDELLRLGRNLVIGGSVQMLLVALPVLAVLLVSGMGWRPAMVIASAASFSSTVLIFKALSEWGQSSLPHGRRAIGILLFQDAALIPLLLILPPLTGESETARVADYLVLAITSIVFVAAVVGLQHGLSRWIIPMLAGYRSPELVVLFSLVTLGGVTLCAHSVGLPAVVGAFAAGLIFSNNRWTKQIDALMLPFRESFAGGVFVSMGLLFDARLNFNEPLLILACLVGLVVLKALAATFALRLTGLRWRASAGTGIGLAHVGEFAFVLVLLGFEGGLIGDAEYQRIIALAIGSLVLAPPLLKIGLRWTRSIEEDHEAAAKGTRREQAEQHAVVIGAGPIGRQVTSQLEIAGYDVCLVDLSPINLHTFAQQGFRTLAGDATDRQILARADAEDASLVVVCVPDDESAIRIVQVARELNSAGSIVVRCRYQSNVKRLRKAGVNQVVSEEAEASHALLGVLANLAEGQSPPAGGMTT